MWPCVVYGCILEHVCAWGHAASNELKCQNMFYSPLPFALQHAPYSSRLLLGRPSFLGGMHSMVACRQMNPYRWSIFERRFPSQKHQIHSVSCLLSAKKTHDIFLHLSSSHQPPLPNASWLNWAAWRLGIYIQWCLKMLEPPKYMDVSKNKGTPKSSILTGFSFINHPFWDTPILGNPHIYGNDHMVWLICFFQSRLYSPKTWETHPTTTTSSMDTCSQPKPALLDFWQLEGNLNQKHDVIWLWLSFIHGCTTRIY